MKHTFLAIGIAIFLAGVYIFTINSLAIDELNKLALEDQQKDKIVICKKGDWLNWSEFNESSGNYTWLPNNIHRCGNDVFEVCDIVNGSECILSKEFKVEVKGSATSGLSTTAFEALSVGDKISVQVLRHRWYGKIIENMEAKGTTGWLYLFGIDSITLPMIIKGEDWTWYHLGTLLTLIFGIIITFVIELIIKIGKNKGDIDYNEEEFSEPYEEEGYYEEDYMNS